MAKPISPDEVNIWKAEILPEEVITAFNNIIAKNWDGIFSRFKQDEVIDEIVRLAPKDLPVEGCYEWHSGKSKSYILDNHWLDVEGIYREEGWDVTYDKPGYNESYESFFKFSK